MNVVLLQNVALGTFLYTCPSRSRCPEAAFRRTTGRVPSSSSTTSRSDSGRSGRSAEQAFLFGRVRVSDSSARTDRGRARSFIASLGLRRRRSVPFQLRIHRLLRGNGNDFSISFRTEFTHGRIKPSRGCSSTQVVCTALRRPRPRMSCERLHFSHCAALVSTSSRRANIDE